MNSKFLNQRTSQLLLTHLKSLTYQGIRCAGTSQHHGSADTHHHDDHHGDHGHGHHKVQESKSQNTQYKFPTQEEKDFQLPKTEFFNDRFLKWVAGRWAVDRDDELNNDKPNKYSAYYWFQNYPLLQNAILLKLLRVFFDNHRIHNLSHHDGISGVKTHENSLFLYKSDQADGLLRARMIDFGILGMFLGLLGAGNPMCIIPLIVTGVMFPKKLATVKYFTFHAELLPHTEQVVFHKANFFGGIKRIYVDVKNIEKIDATIVPAVTMWNVNMFDKDLVFRDMETKEVFVFDANGIWNEDTLKHKLIY